MAAAAAAAAPTMALLLAVAVVLLGLAGCARAQADLNCTALYSSQVCCMPPTIYAQTQQPDTCRSDNTYTTPCFAKAGVQCGGVVHTDLGPAAGVSGNGILHCGGRAYNASSAIFRRAGSCEYVDTENIYEYETALLLAVFLGFTGADRFYLGYPALGLLKLCTCGFFLVGQLIDIILIALQIVTPADGTSYLMNYLGPRISRFSINNETYIVPND
eukprot:m.202970 g.202970  ORF g.202970 m.202970 type:complete len:216 (+) comp17730_c1_seq1:2844-3491(+)